MPRPRKVVIESEEKNEEEREDHEAEKAETLRPVLLSNGCVAYWERVNG